MNRRQFFLTVATASVGAALLPEIAANVASDEGVAVWGTQVLTKSHHYVDIAGLKAAIEKFSANYRAAWLDERTLTNIHASLSKIIAEFFPHDFEHVTFAPMTSHPSGNVGFIIDMENHHNNHVFTSIQQAINS